MNEQSINNIVAYLQQYPDVPTEELVKNILQEGYKMEDLQEALRRQGISPIVIPGYVEPEPAPSKPLFVHMPFIIGIVVILLLIAGGIFIFLSSKSDSESELSGQIQQGVIAETTPIPAAVDISQSPLSE